jgi:hypothetical protein
MRLAGSCHQEWGYLAPSRRSMWKMRLFIFAAAIGASASGAACCSIIYHPAAASVEKTTDMSQARLRMDSCSPGDPGRVEDAGVLAPTSGAPRTRGRPDCPNRAGAEDPPPGAIAANVQTGTADSPAVSGSGNERASTSAASEVPGARGLRAPSKRTRAVIRTVPRYGSYAASGYQPWYGAREQGSYGLQSRYGSHGTPAYH